MPADIVGAAVFLVSPAASFVTGHLPSTAASAQLINGMCKIQ
jgi:hypothetical protein